MASTQKFAQDFKPTFSASKLAEICSSRSSESTKLKILRAFRPFSEIKLDINVSAAKKTSLYRPKILLTESEKNEIKRQLDESLDYKELKFDDEKIIETFNDKLESENNGDNSSLQFLVSKLVLTDDENESSSESAYLTAQSDEECFKKYCDKGLAIEVKSKQAVRYISNMRGRKMERSILDRINETYSDYGFVQNKSKKYVDYGNFKIVGIIDGWSEAKRTVLEIKTRKNFETRGDTITRRERLQAMTYMNMFGCERCLFVETGPNGQTKETMIDYDDVFFQHQVLELLDEFTKRARDYERDEFEKLLIQNNIC